MKRSPRPRKRTKPRKSKTPRCVTLRCGKPAQVAGMCRTHAKRETDRLFSLYIRNRDRKCRNCMATEALQAAHVVSRRYMATRWDPDNCITLDRRCHLRQTHNPLEGEVMFDRILGKGHVAEMKYRALHMPPLDIEVALQWLRREVAA